MASSFTCDSVTWMWVALMANGFDRIEGYITHPMPHNIDRLQHFVMLNECIDVVVVNERVSVTSRSGNLPISE